MSHDRDSRPPADNSTTRSRKLSAKPAMLHLASTCLMVLDSDAAEQKWPFDFCFGSKLNSNPDPDNRCCTPGKAQACINTIPKISVSPPGPSTKRVGEYVNLAA